MAAQVLILCQGIEANMATHSVACHIAWNVGQLYWLGVGPVDSYKSLMMIIP